MSEIPDPNAESQAPTWQQVFQSAESGLRAFLSGRLSQATDVDDCLQVVFVKMMESGDRVPVAARKAWLFRVAANESARMWRSKAATEKMIRRHGDDQSEADQADPVEQAILSETTKELQQSLEKLPESWQQVVRLRIHENLTFQQISDRLNIPIGTALTRMRRAVDRLRTELRSNES